MTEAEQFRATTTAALVTKLGIALEHYAADLPDRYHEWIPIEQLAQIAFDTVLEAFDPTF